MNKMNYVLWLGVILFCVIILGSDVSALGVTPGTTSIDFTPSLKREISFSVVNTESKDVNLVIYASGELNESIFIRESMISLSAEEEMKEIVYDVFLPDELSPGVHTADIVVLEVPKSGGGVGAVVGVISRLKVYVPYPGKYAEAEMHITGAEQGGNVNFVIPVVSRGKVDLVNVRANIDIYNSMGEKVGSFNTEKVSVKKDVRTEITHSWKADVPPGIYLAKASVIYDGNTLTLEKTFNVGEMVLELQGIEVNNFKLGEIAKFEMLVENKWGEEISNVYTLMKVFNEEGQVMAEFKSPAESIPAFEKKVLVSYWDTGGVKKGTYDSIVSLIYGEKSVEEDLQLKVSSDRIEIIGFGYVISSRKLLSDREFLIKVLIGAVVVLILINVSWFVFLRKRIFGRRKGFKGKGVKI